LLRRERGQPVEEGREEGVRGPAGSSERACREDDTELMDWVRGFYERQYAWADWQARWASLDVERPGIVAHVAAVERMAGPGAKRILELGAGTGQTAAALAHAGHDVVAVDLLEELTKNAVELGRHFAVGSFRALAADFYEIEFDERFDVVAYFDGFGIGTDEDQRRLLRRVDAWLQPDGCALIDVFSPLYFAKSAGSRDEYPPGVWYLEGFDAETSRMTEQMWRAGHESDIVTQSLRCYSPADLRLLIDGTGLVLQGFEPYSDEGYEQPCPLDEAMLYLAQLTLDARGRPPDGTA
jgi:SAM-dependent methyltransferase